MDSVFSSLNNAARTTLALYTLFDCNSASQDQAWTVVSTICRCDTLDMQDAVRSLAKAGWLHTVYYNWRMDAYDYTVSDEKMVQLMLDLYINEAPLAIKVLKNAGTLRPAPLQKMLWEYISSDFNNLPAASDMTLPVSNHPAVIMPYLCDQRFARFILSLPQQALVSLLNSYLDTVMEKEQLFDSLYLRSLLNDYIFQDTIARDECTDRLDLYDFLALGKRPAQLRATSMSHLIIAAIVTAYGGNAQKAMNHMTKALQYMSVARKSDRLRSSYFPHTISNYFLVVIAALSATESARKTLLPMVRMTHNNPVSNPATVLYDALYNTESETKLQRSLSTIETFDAQSIAFNLCGLIRSYLYMPLTATHTPRWAIMKQEWRKYHQLTEADQTLCDKAYGTEPLLANVRRKQQWEHVLDQLTDKSFALQGNPPAARIAYYMADINREYAEPRVQTVLKSGAWGVGKTMAAPTFLAAKHEAMNDADRRIAARQHAGYNIRFLPLATILPEMTTNSRLFVGRYAPYTVVEVLEDTPYITLTRDDSGFRVSSNVALSDVDDNVIITQRTAESITFVRLDDTRRPYFSQLLSLGHFPLSAEPQLREFLRAVGTHIEVNSDMLDGGSTLPITDGSTQLVMQMKPQGKDNYALSIFVRPLPQGRFRYPPGCGEPVIADTDRQGHRTRVRRDLQAEHDNYTQLLQACDLPDATPAHYILSTEQLLPVVGYAQQNAETIVCEWPEGQQLKIRRRSTTASWSGAIRRNDNGWFEIEGSVEIDQNRIVSLSQLLDLASSSQGRFIRLGEGEFLQLSEVLQRQLMNLNAIATRSHGHLQMSPFSAAVLGEDILDGELQLTADDELRRIRQRILDSSTYSPDVPTTLNATLRPYQVEGFQWMSRLNKWGAGALLADDMGLGKTVQTIAFLLSKADEGPALVVAPASVAPNWKTELERFAPSLNVLMLNFTDNRRKMVANARHHDVVVTTYGLLLSVKDYVTSRQWTTICLDEAHIIKNRGAKTSAVAMQLKGDYRIMLTGTPVQNHLDELWNLFQLVTPGLLGTFEEFARRFIPPIEQHGDKMMQQALARLAGPFMLRRTKDKVAHELPEKEEIYQHVTLTDNEQTLYEVMRQKAEALLMEEMDALPSRVGDAHLATPSAAPRATGRGVSATTLAEITRLRQCSCDARLVQEGREVFAEKDGSKIIALVELLQTIIEGLPVSDGVMQGGVLVFSQFTSYLALIRQALDREQIPYLYLDGEVSIKTRQKLVEEYQNGACPVFLISLKAGGLGLNLTRANYVIHMDPWWNPAIEEQAADRVHRIGQLRPVTVYHLIAEGTIEEKIQRLHERKRQLVHDVLSSADASYRLTGEELLNMVRR